MSHKSTRNGRIKGRRDYTRRLHEQRIQKAQEEHMPVGVPWSPTSIHGNGDPLVVSTSALSTVVNAWIAAHEAEANRAGAYDNDYIGAMDYIAQWSGITHRAIWSITDRSTKYTTLGKADLILTAIGMQHLLATDPKLAPKPNPRWTQEAWLAWKEAQGCV